jgi:hypothetical protein
VADQGWILLIILAGAIWVWYSGSEKGAAASSQSEPRLKYEARNWIRNHPVARKTKRSPLASHWRFMSAEKALQFIDSLYKAGAIDVQIDRSSLDSSWDSTLGCYVQEAYALLVLLPGQAQQPAVLRALEDEVSAGRGAPWLQRHFQTLDLSPGELGQEVVRLTWTGHQVVI